MMIATDDTNDRRLPPAPPFPSKRTLKSPPLLPPHDPWADWKPVWVPHTKKAPRTTERNVHEQQETHSPSENVTLRLTAERTQTSHRRRIVDARLWDAMTEIQRSAALDIAFAFETMGRGIGYVTSNWERIPGARGRENISETHARLVSNYIDWSRACQKRKICHAMAIDILAFGFSCRAVDRARRVRGGTARKNLLDGLTLYCDLRGWK